MNADTDSNFFSVHTTATIYIDNDGAVSADPPAPPPTRQPWEPRRGAFHPTRVRGKR